MVGEILVGYSYRSMSFEIFKNDVILCTLLRTTSSLNEYIIPYIIKIIICIKIIFFNVHTTIAALFDNTYFPSLFNVFSLFKIKTLTNNPKH
jgi:hypothetical protein